MAKKLFNKNFFLLWQGQLVSQIGSQAFSVAMLFWLKSQTGSASLIGVIMMVSALPAVLLSPFAGTLADSYSRKRIIVFSDLLHGVLVLALAYFMFYQPEADFLISILFFVAIAGGVIHTFFTPAIQASIPDLVPKEKVDAANALNQTSVQLSLLLGQGIGGLAYVLLGAPLLFLIDGLSYFFSGISESFITIPQKLSEKSSSWKERLNQFKLDTGKGFSLAWKNPGIKALFSLAAVINFFSMPFFVLLPFFVEDFLGLDASWFGYLLAGFGFGSLVGYGLAGGIKAEGTTRPIMAVTSLVVMSLFMIVLGFVDGAWLALVVLVLIGATNGFFNVIVLTTFQTKIESEFRGRIFGLLTTITGGLIPISMGLSGVIADWLDQDIPLIFIISGGITFVLCVLLAFNKDLRDFLVLDSPEDAGENEQDTPTSNGERQETN